MCIIYLLSKIVAIHLINVWRMSVIFDMFGYYVLTFKTITFAMSKQLPNAIKSDYLVYTMHTFH